MKPEPLKDKVVFVHQNDVCEEGGEDEEYIAICGKEDVASAVEFLKERIKNTDSKDICFKSACNYTLLYNYIDEAFEDVTNKESKE